MSLGAGDFDRRIQVQVCVDVPDAAGDPVPTWRDAFKRWAKRKDGRPQENAATGTAQQVLRQVDTTWILRADSQSADIAPESHRFVYQARIYEIVGVSETADGVDAAFLTCSRPGDRGPRGRGAPDGQP